MWLVGMMGSGKSTIGARVAKRMGLPFFDTDRMVQESSKMSIAEIWERGGETMFRRLEAEAIASVPARGRVAAAGGGAVLDVANREMIAASQHVMWLRCSPETLDARLDGSHQRPLLDRAPDRLEWLRATLERRDPLYSSIATMTLDTDDSTEDQVVEEVIRAWRA